MYNHAPENYKCALCLAVQGREEEPSLVKKDDIFYQDDAITAFVSSYIYSNSPGHVVIIPNMHQENLYDLGVEKGHKIMDFSREVAIALKKVLDADGTSVQQHNEPAGNQHVFHYHMHVFPRFENDELYSGMSKKRLATDDEKKKLADKLKEVINFI
jgi:histidine triad (HIT) family protein